MDLKIRDVAELLNVSETTIRRWLAEGKIPAYRLNHQYRFSRIEIENWMMSCRLGQEEPKEEKKSEDQAFKKRGMQQFSLYRALHRGGVFSVKGTSKEEIIRSVMKDLAKELGADADMVSELLLDRERLMPTALNNGIAVPHTREFVATTPFDVVALVHLETPVDWGALDEKQVHTLFFLFATEDKRHLHLLAKIAHLSASEEAFDLFSNQCDKAKVLEFIKGWESKIRHLNE